MTTYYFVKDLLKAEQFVKPFVRTKKGKLEHVKGHTRYVVGEPVSVEEQSAWVKKQKKLLNDIKGAFTHGEFDYLEASKELMKQFSMSAKEATTYVDKWKAEIKVKSNDQLKLEIKEKFIQGQSYEKTIKELVGKGLINEQGAVKLVNEWHEQYINDIVNILNESTFPSVKKTLEDKMSLLPESLNALEQSKLNALYDIQQGLLKGGYDTYAAVKRVSDITGWWLEANTLLVMSWLKPLTYHIPEQKEKEPIIPVGAGAPAEWENIPKETVLDISNDTIVKWAKLTTSQKKEIEQIKKQFFYYKINKTNALSRLVFITGIGKVGDNTGIEDLNKIIEEWGKNKYKYSKEKAKENKKWGALKQEIIEAKASGLLPTEGYEEPEYLKPEKPKPWKVTEKISESPFQPSPNEEFLAENEKAKLQPQGIEPPKVSQTLLPRQLLRLTGKLGTNPGGTYKDSTTGLKYYVKAYEDKQGVDSGAAQARVEHLANKIYQHLGIATVQTELIYMNDFNKICIASRWIEGAQKIPIEEQVKSNDVMRGFVADAYLKNWDVAGLDYENIVKDPVTGQLIRSDNGGVMMFRAQGSAKEFETDKIPELQSMKDSQHGAGKVFKGVTEDFIKAQAQYLVSNLKEADIDRLVEESGLTGTIRNKAIDGLKGRREYLINTYALTVPAEEQTVFALYEGATTAMKEGFAVVGTHHSAVKGKLVTFPGFEDIQFFQYKTANGEYGIAELTTGLNATGNLPTEKQALDKAKEVLTKHGLEFTKGQINKFEHKAPQVPHESQLKVWTIPKYKLPNGKVIWEGNWIKYNHANPHNNYKVKTIYANNKLHIEEQDKWGNKVQEFDMTITPDIITTTEPNYADKTPPPNADITPKVLERITNVWRRAKEIANKYDQPEATPKLKEFNKMLHNCFEENPYVFRAVSYNSFHTCMNQILNEHILTGSNHEKGTTCMSISPWSSVGFGQYMFVLDKEKLKKNADWVKPIQYYNYELAQKDPKTFGGKDHEHGDIYSASYVNEMEVRAKHIHDPLSVISEIWIHRDKADENEKWKMIEEVESKYPQIKGKVRVLNVYKDLKWPKGMVKSLKKYFGGLKW